ncbi:methyltransferase domain-containing protein [Amaricoccus solimangrovi]|uniref:Methyltransferase domain-containing protein n=1 Tax=Amaricoccus solimangrovi TaxID=2589815 RepID=A0A501WV51_9RHOB|nr:methyltransferase domain-containing protein [Amaricoccus solimangrovi]
MPGLAARSAAAALLAGVLERGASLADQIAAPAGPLAGLVPADRARAQALATGALRHLGRIDAVLSAFLTKPPAAPALNALRLAVAETRLDAVPAHAAVDAAVRLTRQHPKGRHLAGLVNAVGRRIGERGAELWETAAEAETPPWLAKPLRRAYGPEVLAAITAAHHAGPPPVDLTPRDPAAAALWAERLGAELLPTGSLRLRTRSQLSALPGYESGDWWVQDVAAALPARLLGPVAGLRVLDLCAAPGGKTLQLAAAGARVTALDISEGRLGRLRDNLARTGLGAEIVVADARDWAPEAPFDAILLDAPCSATGTIRRHPDLPHLRGGAEVAALTGLQAALLARAWTWLAPGGRLVYCVCSLLPAEGEERIARFRAETPEARPLPPPAGLGLDPAWITPEGALRTRPDFWAERGGMDGFFAAVLARG